jgi:pullulanase
LRKSNAAFDDNAIEFFHVDVDHAKRVLAWRRGKRGSDSQVVVAANFSDFGTPNAFDAGAEYRVSNWPDAPADKRWKEVPQEPLVLSHQVGREPISPWEAKIYTVV